MQALALLGGLLGWLIYTSVFALLPALIAWRVLRWCEGCAVVFNRVYLACLGWCLGIVLTGGVIAVQQHIVQPPLTRLLEASVFRIALAASMVLGALLMWRLVPRMDARRVRPFSACIASAAVMLVLFGLLSTIA